MHLEMALDGLFSKKDREPDYDWVCGLCKAKPKFPTLLELFLHKQNHLSAKTRIKAQKKDKTTLKTDTIELRTQEEKDSEDEKESIGDAIDHNGDDDDDDDIPLSRLTAKEGETRTYLPKNRQRKMFELEKNLGPAAVIEKSLESIEKPKTNVEETKTDLGLEFAILVEEAVGGFEKQDWNNPPEPSPTKDKLRFFCRICGERFRARHLLSNHKILHKCPETNQFRCEFCKKSFKKYDNFVRHLPIHMENRPKPFNCEFCGSNFFSLFDLKRHINLHLEVKPFTCEYCSAGFMRHDKFMCHMAQHTGEAFLKFTCKVCGRVLNSPSSLAMHSKSHSEKSLFCEHPGCKFSCHLNSQLKQHIRTHKGEKPYQCQACGRCFGRSNDMKNHILNVHERFRPFKCQNCPKEFTIMSALKSHQATHMNVRPYLCDECGKRFCQSSTLRKHVQGVHNGVVKRKGKIKEAKKFADVGVQSDPVEETNLSRIAIQIPIRYETVRVEPNFIGQDFVPTISIPSPPPAVIKGDSSTDTTKCSVRYSQH